MSSDDFFLAVAGLWQIDAGGSWQPRLTRLFDLVMDGLRAGAPARSPDRGISGPRAARSG